MVSTRGVKYKFGEGEKVLCYEPDPTKAKVLYDSKVLEVVENKDKRGRKSIEYLIHFQGWNSSWDRCVGEDYVLKDTEENRQLQRDLAAKSQLQIGAYLYRRCRNKRSRKLSDRINDSIGSGGKTRRAGSSEDGSSCSTTGQRDIDTDDTQQEDGDSETCSSLDNADLADEERAHIDLGDILRSHLDRDFEKVKQENKLHCLPVNPNVVTILENYVKHYALQQLTMSQNEPTRGRKTSPVKRFRDLDKVCRNLNICKEVCDGLRIYFDFTLKDHLLYLSEVDQLNEYLTGDKVKIEIDESVVKQEEIEIHQEQEPQPEYKPITSLSLPDSPSDIPMFAHLSAETTIVIPESEIVTLTNTTAPITRSVSNQQSSNTSTVNVLTTTPTSSTGGGSSLLNEPRRLRSHKLELVQEMAVESSNNSGGNSGNNSGNGGNGGAVVAAGVGGAGGVGAGCSMQVDAAGGAGKIEGQGAKEEQALSIATTSSRCSTPRNVPSSSSTLQNINSQTNLKLPPKWDNVLKQVQDWKIVPENHAEEDPTAPSLIYGAVHLTRLLVKLPEFLAVASIPVDKLSVVIKHIDNFIDYLEEHKEWYEEVEYK